MDAWSDIQIKKMESGGNDSLNAFLARYSIPKETDIVAKYNTNAAKLYRDRIQALADGRPWRDPPIVKENLAAAAKPPRNPSAGGWDDDWGNDARSRSTGDFRTMNGGGGAPVKSRSSEDIYTRSQLEASAANKEGFFAKKMAENESRPDGIPPSQGGKYVGFGSSPGPPPPSQRSNQQNDYFSVVSQGIGKLSLVAASAAQSAATVVQAGTKEITSKVKEGGYDQKVNETVTVVTQKTSEIGHRTWGLMKGVMAIASQKVEEYTKDNPNWKTNSWQQNENDRNGYYQDFNSENKGGNSSTGREQSSSGQFKTHSSSSWDDWDLKDSRKEEPIKRSTPVSSGEQFGTSNSSSWDDWDQKDSRKEEPAKGLAPHNHDDGWAGWDNARDDGFDHFSEDASTKKAPGHNGKSDANWTGGGFL